MTPFFVDTNYLIASFLETDQWHQRVLDLDNEVASRLLVTTDSVLCEFLNYFSGYGPHTRQLVTVAVSSILADPRFEVLEQTRSVFLKGTDLYAARLDKGYSLTDCISMNVCREMGIADVLTHDRHFEQEGFKVLL